MAIQKGDINPATGKQYAVNPATGVWDDTYWAEVVEPRLKAQGLQGGDASGFNIQAPQTPDYEAITKRAIQLQKEAVQPGIESYQSYTPVVQKGYEEERTRLEGEKEPLQQRYQNLLNQVTQRQQQEEQRTGIATSAELGRRGISSESGLYAQEVNRALSPITQFYTGQAKELGLSQEDAERNLQNLINALPQQERESLWQVQNAIAQLQSGAGQAGISSGLQQFQLQQQANQQAAQFALQQAIAKAEQSYRQQQLGFSQQQSDREQLAYELSKREFEEYKLPLLQYETKKPYSTAGSGINITLPSSSSVDWNKYQY